MTNAADSQEDVIDRGVSEFGEILGEFIEGVPHALGIVLSDGVDDTIDTAHRPAKIESIDVCIAGAQIGQAMCRLTIDTIIFGLGRALIVLEGDEFVLMSKLLWEEYLVTSVLDPKVNIARAMREFEEVADKTLALLR